MKRDGILKHLLIAFLLAACAYIVAFAWIEHRRMARGPWQVTFGAGPAREPRISIVQHGLGITNRVLTFPGQVLPETFPASGMELVFDRARPVPYDVPFGQVVFQDATFMPGSITFRLFGAEIELLPRTLVINHAEIGWYAERETKILRSTEVRGTGQ